MEALVRLFDLAGGKPLAEEDDGPAHRLRLMLQALLASVVFAALFGLAAGSTDLGLALANLYKLPMVLVLSALAAVPATLLTWKLSGAGHRCTDLLMGLTAGNFTASLVLAVMAPVVALYYHTSGYLGGTLAMGAAVLALLVGLVTMLRGVWRRLPEGTRFPAVALPVGAMALMQLAVLLQLVHVASPILPEITVFDGGADAVLDR